MKAVEEKLRRAISMILALTMALSLFSVPGFSWTALAAEEPSPHPETTEEATKTAEEAASSFTVPRDSSNTNVATGSGKPMLYIDFLGDTTSMFSGNLPKNKDQSAQQENVPGTPNGPWQKYGPVGSTATDCTPTVPGTVFWVGVGIDKMTLFELSKDGKGLTGVELGFYYNTEFVMPWMGDGTGATPVTNVAGYNYNRPTDFKQVLESKNLTPGASVSDLSLWDENAYQIVEAIPSRDSVMEPNTQQMLIKYPNNADMAGGDWEMLYVSLEKKNNDWDSTAQSWNTPNRFSDPTTLDDGTNGSIYYVMMLPFVLKDYDPNMDLCFRLSRNASVFSMGGGEDGAGTYDDPNDPSSFGAWERQTRTPRHNLKDMFAFEGDLNIFKGFNEPDDSYTATLNLVNQNNDPSRTAKLYPTTDPGIYIDTHGSTLVGLTPGTELTLEVGKGSDTTVGVTVKGNLSSTIYSYVEVKKEEKYTFVMPSTPAEDVTVTVTYTTQTDNPKEYKAELQITDPTSKPENYATLTGLDDNGISEIITANNVTPNDDTNETPGDTVTLHVETHPDDQAKVEVKTKAGTILTPVGPTANISGGEDYTFTMPQADVVVSVTYSKKPVHYAELAIDANSNGSSDNKARLSFVDYSVVPPTTPSVSLDGVTGGRAQLGPIPQGREVTLDIAVASGYTVSEIRLYTVDDNDNLSPTYVNLLPNLIDRTPPPPAGDPYTKTLTVGSIVMPNDRIRVYVAFAEIRDYSALLVLDSGKNAEMEGKKLDGTSNQTDMQGTPRINEIFVAANNTVTVTLNPDPGKVVDRIVITPRYNPLYPQVTHSNTISSGTVTFTMPAYDVVVRVYFKDQPKYRATLVLQPASDVVNAIFRPVTGTTTGWPQNPGAVYDRTNPVPMDYPTKYDVLAGDTPTTWVDLMPGWYINSIRVIGRNSDITDTVGYGTGSGKAYSPLNIVGGNGYNNGAGGLVRIQITQPDEDSTVYVELKQGVPPVEPEHSLTLRVEDPDNTGAPLANNWAQVSISGNAAVPTPPVTIGNNDYLVTPIISGQLVTVIYHADPGYYVDDVEVTPSTFGIIPGNVPGRTDAKQFNMPGGPVTVTVKFKKRDPAKPPYQANLHISGALAGESATLNNATLTPNQSVTGNTDGTYGPIPAWPGDRFETTAVIGGAAPPRNVLVEVYQGGTLKTWTATGTSGDGSGYFTMPAGDVDVYVTYRDVLPPGDQYRISLTAYGLPGEAEGDAGTATLTVDGTAITGAPALSNDNRGVPTLQDFAFAYQTIEVTATPKPGYVVDKIIYSTAGSITPVDLVAPAGSKIVQFTMPEDAVSVEVYFRKGDPIKHKADIVIRPPAGVSASDVGDAQFIDALNNKLGYSTSAAAGTLLDVWAYAKNGYYISKIEITPAALGVMSPITGVFSNQTLGFVMPDADCTVNVYYEKGWPDSSNLQATLRVHGPGGVPGNNAQMTDTTQSSLATNKVVAGASESLTTVKMGDKLKVKIEVDPNYSLDHPIQVTDSAGTAISYQWSGTDEITFDMPNTWVNVDVTFKKGPDNTNLNATLHNNISGSSVLTNTITGLNVSVTGVGQDTLTGQHPGELLQVDVSNITPGMVPQIWAAKADGSVISLPAPVLSGGVYTTSLFMQDQDVDIYVGEVAGPKSGEHLANLIVTELNNGNTSHGSQAEMADQGTAATTGPVVAQGSGAVSVVDGNTVEITVAPGTGYVLESIKVNGGVIPVTQDPTNPNRYTYVMPSQDTTAVVTFKPWDPAKKLTAQVVLDNGGGTGNNALIREAAAGTPLGSGAVRLTDLSPNDQILVDLTVQPGYKVQLVAVYPTSGGTVGVSTMTLPPNQDQTVQFFMPSDDVIVFVRFVDDGAARYKISMTVVDEIETNPTPNYNNTATIHTDYSGTTNPPSKHGDPAVTVEGAVNDVVTVKANPDNGYWVSYSAVLDDGSATPVSVPDLTVSTDGKTATFSVPNDNVKVVVTFHPNSVQPPSHKVTLHITGIFTNTTPATASDYCELLDTYVQQKDLVTNRADGVNNLNTVTAPTQYVLDSISVPYLKEVSVGAKAKAGYYIQSAYASYGGVNLPALNTVNIPASGPLTERTFDFKMQNGDVDVYVVITDTPPVGKHTAKLEVVGPPDVDYLNNPVIGAAGSAILTNTTVSPNISTVSVGSNKTFDPATDQVVANENDVLTVEVTVNPGYSIDRIIVTPLSLNLRPTSITTNSTTGVKTYTYTMPADDVGIIVILKSDNVDRYKVTLELIDADTSVPSSNKADVSYTAYHLTTDGAWMNVPDGQYVTVETTPGSGYYVHHAYAVTKDGTVLPLIDANTPPNHVSLQHPSTDRKAMFVMPAEDVDVKIEFSTTPPTGDYSAVLTVVDNDPTHASKATLTLGKRPDGSGPWSVTADSGTGTQGPISVNAGETLQVTLNLAPGYILDGVIVVSGGLPGAAAVTVTQDPNNSNLYTFTMPAHDVGVIVKLKTADKYTATLHIVDHSSTLGSTASMKEDNGTITVTGDGAKLTDLSGNATVETTAMPQTGVVVRAVIATDGTGTHNLTLGSGHYDYTLQNQNVDITVIFDNNDPNDPDLPKMYIAMVEKTGSGANRSGNTATVTNTSNPALPNGQIWTGIYGETPQQRLQVDIQTEANYYATVTARTKDGSGADVAITPVLQLGNTGTVTAYLDVPATLYDNVIITVEYTTTPPTVTSHNLELELVGHGGDAGNTASITDAGVTTLNATAAAPLDNNSVAEGTALNLSTTVANGFFVEKTELSVTGLNGTTVTIALPVSGDFAMPTVDAKVTVTLKQGDRTPRPHDWNQHPSNNNYIDGYLYGTNLGGNQAKIQVPNLYRDLNTSAAYVPNGPHNQYEYKLYLKAGGSYVELKPKVDYDVIAYNPYTPDSVNLGYCNSDGWEFVIRSMAGEKALTEILKDGGILYITATDTVNSKQESEYVEVVLPGDPYKGHHKATLHIVDTSGITGNTAQMTVAGTTVTNHGDQVTGLQGNELIRTQAKAAPGARISAVTVTDSAGTRLLPQVPSGFDRYPYYMTGEDVIITVYFSTSEDNPDPNNPPRYIAAVTKTGAISVPGNDATIQNDTRNDLSKGSIWAEGYEKNVMKVTVDVAAGYYATITAVNKKTNQSVTVTALGAGPGVTQFDALLTMPAADVQVTVEFTKEAPKNLENDLTLEVIGHDNLAANIATLTEVNTTNTLTVFGSANAADTKKSWPQKVKAGTKFTLLVDHAANYYVYEARVKVFDTSGSLLTTLIIALSPVLDTTQTPPVVTTRSTGNFTMPLNAAAVEVEFKKDIRTARPFDPDHSVVYNTAGYPIAGTNPDLSNPTQEGWILADNTLEPDTTTGNRQMKITVPTLHDDDGTYTDVMDALSSAGDAAGAPAASYKLYWKDSYGNYHPLAADIVVTPGNPVSNTYTVGTTTRTYDGYEFTVMTRYRNSQIDYYMKNGGTIYITATKTPTKESDYTQVIIPRAYRATLHYTPYGQTATMEVWGKTTSLDNGTLIGTNGQADVVVKNITADPGYHVLGVVATTDVGSKNAVLDTGTNEYKYKMEDKDVDLYVVFEADNDPLNPKGPYIATVQKVGDQGLAGNSATIKDLDVTIPSHQKGNIWTAAYEGNVVRVDVTTEPGFYAVITAKEINGGPDVPVVMFGGYGQFYMPNNHVDVTVEYIKGPMPKYDLTIEILNHGGLAGNFSTAVTGAPDSRSTTVIGNGNTMAVISGVPAGTTLDVITRSASTPNQYHVEKAELKVDGIPYPIAIPLTNGTSLPSFAMPMANAKIEVTYALGAQPPRPYDPDHANRYNPSYSHNTADDLSQTHQDGWIKAAVTDRTNNKFNILVPTLHNKANGADTLYHATNSYKLYWKDNMGNFQELIPGQDIIISGGTLLPNHYTDNTASPVVPYTSFTFDVQVVNPQTLWGGYTLKQYIANGGSIYISTYDSASNLESEKTEVVFAAAQYQATLHFNAAEGSATMGAWGQTTNVDMGTLTGANGQETVWVDATAATTPAPGYVLSGVVATTASGSVNAVWNAANNRYEYTMNNEDVDIYVVFDKADDPFKPKGPYIATVYKRNDGGQAGNNARIQDMDVTIPASQKGNIWTAAYEGNVVRVDVSTAPGYYAVITAETVGNAANPKHSVTVAPFAVDARNSYGLFYMENDHVNVTVEYIYGTPPDKELTLEVVDAQNNPLNTAQVTQVDHTVLLTANGQNPKQDGPTAVAPGTELVLVTGHAAGNSVQKAEIIVNGVPVAIPLTNGTSLPNAVMPLADAKIVVTFIDKDQYPRPYDPEHSNTYTPAYNHYQAEDLSQTHQDGWILATNVDAAAKSLEIEVPALYDAPNGVDTLHDTVSNYNLYWKDNMGNFQKLVIGTDISVTVSTITGYPNSAGGNYIGHKLVVTVLPDASNNNYPTLWGGHTLTEYLSNGGSLYISACDPLDPNGPMQESEKTEVVIPKLYKATLHYTPNGTAASMDAWGQTTTGDGSPNGTLTGINGKETVEVYGIVPDTDYLVDHVVATTASGSVNASWNSTTNRYEYTMVNEDVDLYVVYKKKNDPLKDKGPYIATVQKVGHNNLPGNDASILDQDVVIPPAQKGNIWTAAYEGNTVRVDVTTEPGYYAVITAETKGITGPKQTVTVTPYVVDPQNSYGIFYMPGDHVDVTVEYIFGTPPAKNLTLEVVDAQAQANNTATITLPDGSTLNAKGSGPLTDTKQVNPGDALALTTTHENGHSVQSAELIISGSVPIPIPLTNGSSLPIPNMPAVDATVRVTFQNKPLMARPYDPDHSEKYNGVAVSGDYQHNVTTGANPDLSQTHQEGWILATDVNTTSRSLKITVPSLYDSVRDDLEDTVDNYKLYWKDGMGVFQELVIGTDISVTGQQVTGYPNGSGGNYRGYELTVTILAATNPVNPVDPNYPTLWGGYTLNEYLSKGGSIYISALDVNNLKAESEKTEVVIPASQKYQATLHFNAAEGSATMGAWGQTTNVDMGTLTGANGQETVWVDATAATTPAPGYVLSGVVATTASGSVNAVWNAANNRYEYTMNNEDVDIYVVFDKADDPFKPKGPYIATVYKRNDGGQAGNNARIQDMDVTIPASQKGNIWTAAYEGNVVRVDVSTAPGYYAVITAETVGNAANPKHSVTVAPFAVDARNSYGLFYMENDHVNVTVEYIYGTPPDKELTLEVVDAQNNPLNTAQVTQVDHTVLLTANGQNPKQDGPTAVAPGTELVLVTGHAAGNSVQKAEIIVNGVPVAIPLTNGTSLPNAVMPLADAKIVVTFIDKDQYPRPYDPEHSNTYTPAYNHYQAEDLSQTHQDGWILATNVDAAAKSLEIEVPALYDAPNGVDTLHDTVSNYNLYWKDNMGNFQKLVIGTDISVTVSTITGYPNSAGGNYIGHKLVVTVLPDASNNNYPTLWGGHTLTEYLSNGGSLYISACDPLDPNGPMQESEKTEVVIPKLYKATLHYTPNGTAASMDAWGQTTTGDGSPNGTLTGINGKETVEVYGIVPDTDYLVDHVVATTASGSVNASWNSTTNRYEYTMVNEDVDLYVVYKKKNDPLKDKGPYIATVQKVGHNNLPGNDASILDQDVVIPPAQKGNIWTAAYEGNTVRVDVTTEPGYYAVITAETKGITGPKQTVTVTPYVVDPQNSYGIFYMPGDHVDVTVEYIFGTPPAKNLTLEVVDAQAQANNTATITLPDGSTLNAKGSGPLTDTKQVNPGDALALTTTHENGHSVQSAELIISGSVPIPIPLTNGSSLPIPNMPAVDATVRVTFQNKPLMARPYDPDHSEKYNGVAVSGDYQHNVTTGANPDLSQTHQEGWILATDVNTTSRSLKITVPSLYDSVRDDLEDTVDNYKLYWKDGMGVFQELVIGTDISVTGQQVTGYPNGSGGNYRGYELTVTILAATNPVNPVDPNYPTLWGGYTLNEYLSKGGSIYISALDVNNLKAESEKTEVVIPGQDKYKATLHYTPNGTAATMEAWGDTTNQDGAPGGTLMGTNGREIVSVYNITPDTNCLVDGVVATTKSGTTNAVWNPGINRYEYTMRDEDVDLYVVYKKKDDKLKAKGPYIATVYKVGYDNLPANDATIQDVDVTIPATQKGNIWTAAYDGNVVRVDVTTEPGYYAVITAETVGNAADPKHTVPVAQFVTGPQDFYGLFYMEDDHVDVTVTYIKGQLPGYELTLTTKDTNAQPGNGAGLEPDGMTPTTIFGMDTSARVPNNSTLVTAGTELTLTTGVEPGYSVKSATLTVNGQIIDIRLMDGVSKPKPTMPMGDTEIIVTFQVGDQTARPYDPAHSTAYNSANYPTTANPDLSDPTQEGWILATTDDTDPNKLTIKVPTLYEKVGGTDTLYDAGDPADQPVYKVYWKDSMGNFQELIPVNDVVMSAGTVAATTWTNGAPGDPYLNSYTFDMTAILDSNNMPTLWGGYTLQDYIANGGFLYITATGGASGTMESEKTQVVIRAQMARPYEPIHSEAYNSTANGGTYKHNVTTGSNPDRSQTHQEGWILASSTYNQSKDAIVITVRTLHKDTSPAPGTLYNAVDHYKLYWKDDTTGDYHELTSTVPVGAPAGTVSDVTFSNGAFINAPNPACYNDGFTDYDLYTFQVNVVMNTTGSTPVPATTGGTELADYIANGGSIWITAIDPSNPQKLESEMTEVVIYTDNKLRPYDPENEEDLSATPPYDPPYEDHWITSENRGDYLIVTVPMLNTKDNSAPTSVNDPTNTALPEQSFHFYLVDSLNVNDPNADKTAWIYQDLAPVIELTHPDPDNTTDRYENDVYYTDQSVNPNVDYNGARFILTPKTDEQIEEENKDAVTNGTMTQAEVDALKALAALLRAVIDNQGTDNAILNGLDMDGDGQPDVDSNGDPTQRCRLFITHQEDDGTNPVYESDYVDFEVPRYYSIVGQLESYAPTHITTFTLTGPAIPPSTDPEKYVSKMSADEGAGMWQQDFKIKLTSDWDKLDQVSFDLTIEKAGHVTYERTAIILDQTLAANGIKLYDQDKLEFSFSDPIRLFCGDVDGNGAVKAQDVDLLYAVLYRFYPWTTEPDDANDPMAWSCSVYNPESIAYICDLNGDGRVTSQDLDIIYEKPNYNRSVKDYGDPSGLGGTPTTRVLSLRYQWVNDLLFEGKTIPDWALDLVADGKDVPEWAVERIQAERDVPSWALKLLNDEREVPAWAVKMLQAEQIIPTWATSLLCTDAPVPVWAIEMLQAEKSIPDWAIEMAEKGKALPQWTAELLLGEKDIPAWAVVLAQTGENLPEEVLTMLENGEDLPEILPEPPVAPEVPVTPENPAEPGISTEPPAETNPVPGETESNGTDNVEPSEPPAESEPIPGEKEDEPAEGDNSDSTTEPVETPIDPDSVEFEGSDAADTPTNSESIPGAGETDVEGEEGPDAADGSAELPAEPAIGGEVEPCNGEDGSVFESTEIEI